MLRISAQVSTGLAPQRRTRPSGAACSAWPAAGFAVCSVRAGSSGRGGRGLRLPQPAAFAAASLPSSAASAFRLGSRRRSGSSRGGFTVGGGLAIPPACAGLALLPASLVAAHALKDVVMCLGALLPPEVERLGPRAHVLA